MRPVMRAQARRAVVASALPKRFLMEPVDRPTIRRGKGEMEARPRRRLPLRPVLQRELVAPPGTP